ncbi:MAG TPA: cytochrome c oxidase subunit 3 [Steroidobacter sp.]|nr:cytochrome c oxidase subunit 3 [Steroidobacter sp.]
MNPTLAYAALVAGVVVWFLLVRKLTVRTWETAGAPAEAAGERVSAARIGLWVFLAVVTSLFALFISAYYMRMGHGHGAVQDWHPISEPPVLWLNTLLLIVASVFMQWARSSIALGDALHSREALLIGGLLTFAFLAGQYFAWLQIRHAAFFSLRSAAVAFFYLLTAVHGLHLLGGLVVWGKTLLRMRRRNIEAIDVRMSVELCTVYWHYLLFVWLVLFALLLST